MSQTLAHAAHDAHQLDPSYFALIVVALVLLASALPAATRRLRRDRTGGADDERPRT